MIRNITIGQYYPTKSKIHSLDPRTKIVCTFLYLISLFFFQNIIGYLAGIIFLAVAISNSRVPFSYITRGLKAVVFLLALTLCFNLFLTKGEVIAKVWGISVTKEGLRIAVFMALRLIFLIIGASIMTLTTSPNRLTDGLEKLLKPFQKIGLPAHEIAMMISIALRFIPILIEETNKIINAQLARGAEFDEGNFVKKAKGMIPILVPLFVSAFRRAGDLALAMESRCYHGGEGRTKINPLQYKKADYVAYTVTVIYFIIAFVVGRYLDLKIWIF